MDSKQMLRSEFLIEAVLKAHRTLVSESDLSPKNEKITRTLSDLVKMVTQTYTIGEEKQILNDTRLTNIRGELLDRLSKAEGEMEKFWADEFLSRDNLTLKDLEDFWYWNNYVDLTGLEVAEFPTLNKENDRAAFIGAGALPLTAIIYHLQTGNPISCVDSDPVACQKASKLLDMLGLDKMDVIHAHGGDLDFDDYGTVFIASLVSNDHKNDIIEEIKQSRSETLIAVRTAERLHALLYDPYDEDNPAMENCYYVGKTRHNPAVINTTLIYKAESAACTACEKRQQGQCRVDLGL